MRRSDYQSLVDRIDMVLELIEEIVELLGKVVVEEDEQR
jgi:hypothetical protein